MFLLTDGVHGIHQWEMLARQYEIKGICPESLQTLKEGADAEGYDEAITEALTYGYIENQGKEYRLEQDSEGIFAIEVED